MNSQRMHVGVANRHLHVRSEAAFHLQAGIFRIGIREVLGGEPVRESDQLIRRRIGPRAGEIRERRRRRNSAGAGECHADRAEFGQADEALRGSHKGPHKRIVQVAGDRSERRGRARQLAPVEGAKIDAQAPAHHSLVV